MASTKNADIVRRYFDGCNAGDVDALKGTLTPDVVHYFLPGHEPIVGDDHLANHWQRFKTVFAATWVLNRVIGDGDDAVSEWSCVYTDAGTERQVTNRGSEWYLIRDGRIAEIRAYYLENEEGDSELKGFPYRERGYLP